MLYPSSLPFRQFSREDNQEGEDGRIKLLRLRQGPSLTDQILTEPIPLALTGTWINKIMYEKKICFKFLSWLVIIPCALWAKQHGCVVIIKVVLQSQRGPYLGLGCAK